MARNSTRRNPSPDPALTADLAPERHHSSQSVGLQYFSESGLTTMTGHPRAKWLWAILKELVDNGLDACETKRIPPDIRITLKAGRLTVADNGPGIPSDVVSRILNYKTHTSDKAPYISPTRGAQGNAWKTILGMAYVLNNSEPASVLVSARGIEHHVKVWVDHIDGEPVTPDHPKKTTARAGTTVRLNVGEHPRDAIQDLVRLIQDFALFNPHASFLLNLDGETYDWQATNPKWEKWWPSDATSPHRSSPYWYTVEKLGRLIASDLMAERTGSRAKTVREFVSEFVGLSGSIKPPLVLQTARLNKGARLRDLMPNRRLDNVKIRRLLDAMKAEATEIKPDALGPLGEKHFKARFVKLQDSDGATEPRSENDDREQGSLQNRGYSKTWDYQKFDQTKDGLPMLVEVGFCLTDDPDYRGVHFGMNWSPASANALEGFKAFLTDNYIDVDEDKIALVVHLACPRFEFTNMGKGTISLADTSLLLKAVKEITEKWSHIKRLRDAGSVQAADHAEYVYVHGKPTLTPKSAAFKVMAVAYREAAGDLGLAESRFVYYAARPKILAELAETGDGYADAETLSGKKFDGWLKEYQKLHPVETEDWDVIYHARGTFVEPHTNKAVGLGTLEVREYLDSGPDMTIIPKISTLYPTHGPEHRFGAVLFIEKEGFEPLIEKAEIRQRWDIAIAYNKGQSTIASRHLLHELQEAERRGVKILAIHDFDVAGFYIMGTLREAVPSIIDMGLSLEDIDAWELEPEPVNFRAKLSTLLTCGATWAAIEYMRRGKNGQRVELNAFGIGERFIKWLEAQLRKHGVKKIIPDPQTRESHWRRAMVIRETEALIRTELPNIEKRVARRKVPAHVLDLQLTEGRDERPWDVADLAAPDRRAMRKKLAEMAGVSEYMIRQAQKLARYPELSKKVKQGKLSMNEALKQAKKIKKAKITKRKL